MSANARKYLLFTLLLVGSLGLDQASKWWAREHLSRQVPPQMTVIRNLWEFRYSENPGSAFGMFRDLPAGTYLLTAAGILALAYIGYALSRADAGAPMVAVGFGLVAGGAIGNIVDRLLYGKVTDFIVWFFVGSNGRRHEWYTFNVADAAIVAGVLALVLFGPRKKAKEE